MVLMKYKNILMAAVAALGLFPAAWTDLAHAQHRADPQHLSQPGGSTLILFGDPQGYIKYDLNQPLFDLCMAWVADNIRPLNIQAVLFTGDMVEQNDNNALDRRMLNQSSRQMWEAVSNGIRRIDGKVPYIICGGNHDYGFKHAEDPHTYLPDYFTFERQVNIYALSIMRCNQISPCRAGITNSWSSRRSSTLRTVRSNGPENCSQVTSTKTITACT